MEIVRSRDNTPIAYERSGQGPPLVLVHGSTADHTRWAPLLPELGRHFTVYAIDRRGYGQSGDSEPYSIEREFEDAAGQQANLLGHSYGSSAVLVNEIETV
jgi:pimeloyl-ACP methyl ester carboxylesterase